MCYYCLDQTWLHKNFAPRSASLTVIVHLIVSDETVGKADVLKLSLDHLEAL